METLEFHRPTVAIIASDRTPGDEILYYAYRRLSDVGCSFYICIGRSGSAVEDYLDSLIESDTSTTGVVTITNPSVIPSENIHFAYNNAFPGDDATRLIILCDPEYSDADALRNEAARI